MRGVGHDLSASEYFFFIERLRQTLHVQHKDELEQQNLQFEEELEYVKDELKKTKELRTKEVNFFIYYRVRNIS